MTNETNEIEVMNETMNAPLSVAESRRIWELTADAWEQRLRAIRPEDLTKPTPCEAWDVRALIEHAIGVQARYGAMLGYEMGEDTAWESVRAHMVAGLADDHDLLTGTVQYGPLGDTPRHFVLGIVINDLLVHTWDLARAIGADDTLPAEAVAACLVVVGQAPAHVVRHPKVWGDSLPVAADADPQTRLLAQVGRRSA